MGRSVSLGVYRAACCVYLCEHPSCGEQLVNFESFIRVDRTFFSCMRSLDSCMGDSYYVQNQGCR